MPRALNGDTLPGTGGGTEDGTEPEDIDGPWLDDNGDVAFEADTINTATAFEGSLCRTAENRKGRFLVYDPV